MKIRPSDNPYPQRGDDDEQTDDEQAEKEESLEKDEQFNKEEEELKRRREEVEKRREKQKEKFEKEREMGKKKIREEEGEIKIGGQKVKSQKDFLSTLKENKSPFKHKKLQNFSTSGGKKIEKILKRVGVSSRERKEFYSGLKAYGMKKSILKESELKEYYMGVKHKFRGFRGKAGFKKMRKNIGEDDLNNLKKIKRQSVKKMFDALSGTGEKKHQMRPSSNRNPGAGRPGSTSPSRIKNR